MTTAVVFAYHDVGARCLRVLLRHGVQVPLVVTHRDDPGETIWFESVEKIAVQNGIPAITPGDANAPEVVARIAEIDPGFLFSFYYRRMLGPQLLAASRRGAFNMHGSLLPKYRGRSPVNWAILKGESETGATLHEMTEKPDAGRIVDQEPVPIGEDDLAVDVFRKMTDAAEKVLERSLPGLLNGSAVLRPQNLAQGSYFGGRKPEDGRIDWSRPAREIHDLVRAVAPPFPGAFTELQGTRLRVLRTRLEPGRAPSPGGPGLYIEGREWFADCADGKVLRLVELEVQPALERLASSGKKIPLQPNP
jgi:methionyl-tRNA formyltransferase